MADAQTQTTPQMPQSGSVLNWLSDIITKQATAGQPKRDPNAMMGAPPAAPVSPQGALPQAKQNVQIPAIAVPMFLQSILAPLMGGQQAQPGQTDPSGGVAKPNDTAPKSKPATGGDGTGGSASAKKTPLEMLGGPAGKMSPLEMIHGVISMLTSMGG